MSLHKYIISEWSNVDVGRNHIYLHSKGTRRGKTLYSGIVVLNGGIDEEQNIYTECC
jgi:hypothetical protein